MTNRMVWGLGRSIWPSLGCALWARWSAKATQWDAVAHWGGVYLTMWKAIVVSTTFGAYVVVPMIDCRLKSIFAMHEHPKEGGRDFIKQLLEIFSFDFRNRILFKTMQFSIYSPCFVTPQKTPKLLNFFWKIIVFL